MSKVNYFICTLGQVQQRPKDVDPRINNINDFVDRQSAKQPQLPAIGFYAPGKNGDESWISHVLNFSDVHRGLQVVAERLLSRICIQKRQTVALLCPSTPDLLLTWLALMRLGHPVLLLAPQCSFSAIAHLCKTCEVEYLLYDEIYAELASKSSTEVSALGNGLLSCVSVQSLFSRSVYETINETPKGHLPGERVFEDETAYLHHTSGTSSGTPKPIPQTHRAGLGVLPTLDGRNEASFTTTPLYHGGIADLFRAWTSNAMIWLFPGKGVPITPVNVVRCLEMAEDSHRSQATPPVKYFSSVPYVLQMMAAEEASLLKLQGMDIVGVGGAALPMDIGDKLVQQNVNLISRFGSAECGFLLSSHRDYASDRDWQYLRLDPTSNCISFELRENGLSELVVLSGWPHMAKKNREDGSYATADLFEPHPSIKNAWRYHSRADAQITLITGKKFDPAPLEAAIATSNLLADVLIFGDGKPYPGILLFRSEEAKDSPDRDLIAALDPMLRKVNSESQSHIRLAQHMLIPMPFSHSPLEKSSKGTILRRLADERYAAEIKQAYTKVELSDGQYVKDGQVSDVVKQVVVSVMGRDQDLHADTDLFSYGVDSVACVHIRNALIQLLPEKSDELPLTVVDDCGTIDKLSEMVISKRHGTDYAPEDQQQLMLNLLKKYSNFAEPSHADRCQTSSAVQENTEKFSDKRILLTGATGALGAHLLHLYMQNRHIARIFCLVRGASDHAATERVRKALSSHNLSRLSPKVTVLRTDLSSPTLGLNKGTYQALASTITIIHHVAWTVNFRLSLSSFSNNLASVQNLLNLALSSPRENPPHFLFCSSVASIAKSPPHQPVPERISAEPAHSGPLGYSRSKWVAERICHAAHQQHTRLHGRIAILRVGQLSGALASGIWNMSEAYPMLLSQVSLTDTLPALRDVPLSWLPVDTAAQSFVEVADGMSMSLQSATDGGDVDSAMPRVYHIVNPDSSAQWTDLLAWVKNLHPALNAVDPPYFVAKLEALQRQGVEHPAMRLIAHWKAAYGDAVTGGDAEAGRVEEEQKRDGPAIEFEMKQTYEAAPVLKTVQPVSEEYFRRMWSWIHGGDQQEEAS